MKTRKLEGSGKKVAEDYYSNSSASSMNTTSTSTSTRKTTCTKKGGLGPSKPPISRPRSRKTRMRKKLQELRSMVPKITKMGKANSIIGEAALYAIELQMRAKTLRARMERIDVSDQVDKPELERTVQQVNSSDSASKNIAKMEVVQVGERGLVKLVCNKGKGVAVSLYEALESLTVVGRWDVENSILNTVAECFELKFTLNVGKLVSLENLKKRVAGAFLKQGFDFIASPQP